MKKETSWLGKNIVYLVALIVTAVWSVTALYIVAKAIRVISDGVDFTAVLSLFGTITAVFMMVLGFYFGSTHVKPKKELEKPD